MKRQAKPSTGLNPVSAEFLQRACTDVNGEERTWAEAAKRINLLFSNAVTDTLGVGDTIALSWIRERARNQYAHYRPLDLTLRETINAYLKSHVMDSATPWQQSLRARINALLG